MSARVEPRRWSGHARPAQTAARKPQPRQQLGAAALIVTVLLCFAMALAVAYVHRALVIDQRTAAHQVRATEAFEAAEAGIEWMLASLNDNRRVDDDCLPSTDASAVSIRDRLLERAETDAAFTPRVWIDHGVPAALQVACQSNGAAWACACPKSGAPSLAAAPSGSSFIVQLAVGDGPGVARVTATGCSAVGAACGTASSPESNAHVSTANVSTSFALLHGLMSLPAAPLVARGDIHGDGVAWLARNDDASSGGLAAQAGGDVQALLATLQGPAGGASIEAVAAHDTALGARTTARFFAAFFGVDDARWFDRAGVRRITCPSDCSHTLAQIIAAGGRNALIAVDGDLRIDSPVELGSADRPVLIAASGAVELNAPLNLHGALYGASATTTASAAGSVLRGAVLSAHDIVIEAPTSYIADPSLLARLKADTGTFARVNGAWRDF